MRLMCGLVLLFGLLLTDASPNAAQLQGWLPDKHVEIIVPFAAGSAADNAARSMHAVWSAAKLIPTASNIVNRGGGGGALGWLYLSQHAKDPHYLGIGSATLLTNHILGTGQLNYTDFTPLATLFTEATGFTVRADSAIKSGGDLIERLRTDPQSISISVGSALGNSNHIAMALVTRASGIDPKRLKVVAFASAGAGMTALLGGHVDVAVSTLGVFVPHVESGKLRVVVIGAPQRLTGTFANVPTWNEHGITTEIGSWRAMFGAKGITPAQVTYWQDVLEKVDRTSEWRGMAASRLWQPSFRRSEETRAALDGQYAILKATLTSLGMTK